MEIIDKFFDDLQELYEFERGLKNERYLILKENELPALEIIIEANRGRHKKIKNEIIVAGIKPDYINTYLDDFKNALYLIELLIEDRLKDELINSFGDGTFEIVSRFKSLAWTMRMEIQKTITFLKSVLDPTAPERRRKELLERLKKKNIESNTPPAETRGFETGLSDRELESLYSWLNNNEYLAKDSDQNLFINSFSGGIINDNKFNKLEWIDKPLKNNSNYNSHTIFQMLVSLKILEISDPHTLTPDIQKKLKLIFKNDLGNPQGKYRYFKNNNTARQKAISNFILDILKP